MQSGKTAGPPGYGCGGRCGGACIGHSGGRRAGGRRVGHSGGPRGGGGVVGHGGGRRGSGGGCQGYSRVAGSCRIAWCSRTAVSCTVLSEIGNYVTIP